MSEIDDEEARRRAVDWYMKSEVGGGEAIDEAEMFRVIGTYMLEKRFGLKLSPAQVGAHLGVTDEMLSYLEAGWGTIDEYDRHFNNWSEYLEIPEETVERYRAYIEKLKSQRGKI